MEDIVIEMGKRIVSRRKQLRLTQEELAERAGITPQTVSTAELGKKAMRPENIIRISEALEVSTDYLLLGKITDTDENFLMKRIGSLTATQYRHLEDIHNSCSLKFKNSEHGFAGKMVNISAGGFSFYSEDGCLENAVGKHVECNITDFELPGEAKLTGTIIRVTKDENRYIVGCRMPLDNMNICEYVQTKMSGK